MRMTSEEFHAWSQRLQFTTETEALIASIRSSPPVRRVTGRANNVTGRYPSPKMHCSIQFESEQVEFYGQPSRIPLSYRAKSGRRTTQWHTPDFFVLRRASADWEEWKPAQSLDTLAASMPARYQQAGTGKWSCPPAEAYAKHLGLSYRLRSSAELHPLEIQSLKFLQDFWAHEVPPNPEQEALARAHIQAHPGIPLSELLATYPDLPVDVVWTLLATRRAFTDLSATLLMRHDQVTLYAEETQVPPIHKDEPAALVAPLPSTPLTWDGRLWRIEALGGRGAIAARSRRAVPGPLHGVQTEQEPGKVSTSFPMPQVASKPTKPRVGQRAPERDPVGKTSALPMRKATGCSFTEVIEVMLSQMEEAKFHALSVQPVSQ